MEEKYDIQEYVKPKVTEGIRKNISDKELKNAAKILEECSNNPYVIECCILTDLSYAWRSDTERSTIRFDKYFNFRPSEDKLCIVCDKPDAQFLCSKCKSIRFCSKKCQKIAWKVHKTRCGFNLFTICINCGDDNPKYQCRYCPVKYCKEECISGLHDLHMEHDCVNYRKKFSKDYSELHTLI